MDFRAENREKSIKKWLKKTSFFPHGFLIDFGSILEGLGWVWGGFWEGFGRTWRVKIVVFLEAQMHFRLEISSIEIVVLWN